ncbi:hypothetical protein J1N35_013886 [Gossypium stocksii]|uniref:Endonuclease/exonuclease/phosphatase domain-containing protein n=1 Tax=Gossypium stocksii TaxID=47602 RepID=A0A9D4A8C5_9ROSI|nr:hypothetical protein J1N35_013886 [Gossypium stocksii]
MERVRRSCGFQNGIDVESEGTRGGLSLAWKGDAGVTLRTFSKRHIDVIVDDNETGVKWRYTGFYGSPYAQKRNEAWRLLRSLAIMEDIPWLVSGDFNEIMYGFEKKRGQPRDKGRIELFRSTLKDCQLSDIGYSGSWFTWERGNLPETNIQEWLDRGVASTSWISMFPDVKVQHLVHSFFDHCPLLINTKLGECRLKILQKLEILKSGLIQWEGKSRMNRKRRKQILKNGLIQWERKSRMNRKRRKQTLTDKLASLFVNDRDEENMAELIDTKIQLNFEIDKDERYWEQRARLNWLKLGDKNTTFFHNSATQRRKRNLIRKLKNDEGRETEAIHEMEVIARSYFQNLFTAEGAENYDYVMSGIDRCVFAEDNLNLTAAYTSDEIREAVF